MITAFYGYYGTPEEFESYFQNVEDFIEFYEEREGEFSYCCAVDENGNDIDF